MLKLIRRAGLGLAAMLAAAVFVPGLPALAAYNFPSLFGPLSGDCTTPSPSSAVVTCTKSNGSSFASMAFQAASSVAITGGTINGTPIGATTPATLAGTTGSFSGALSGAANSFTGLSTQTGGHVVGTRTVTAAATLAPADEHVCTNGAAAFTLTMPTTPTQGEVHYIADCGQQAATYNVTISAGSTKVNYTTAGLVLTVNGQAVGLRYDSTFGWVPF